MITKYIENSGNLISVSSNGRINIDQTEGKITIRNGVNIAVEIGEDGFAYFDKNHTKRIALGQNSAGQQQIIVYDANGVPQILIGQDPKDGSPVIANSTPGNNVINDLMAG